MSMKVEEIFVEILKHVTGYELLAPLGGTSIAGELTTDTGKKIAAFFKSVITNRASDTNWLKEYNRAKETFVAYYSQPENNSYLASKWNEFETTSDKELQAKLIMQIFVPELDVEDHEVTSLWKLSDVTPNPRPYKPDEITIQLNALYSVPESIDNNVPDDIVSLWKNLDTSTMNHIADYDHPVPLFISNEHHELVKCLDEMDDDIAFEKEQGVFREDYNVPVTISISVTHDLLDTIATRWVEWLLKENHYKHLTFFVLSEYNVNKIKNELIGDDFNLFSVFGKYAVHFNALKYSQLFLEKAYGIRAGFKLDTDEGMRSKDLFKASGKTWIQTLCHELWGATAKDYQGREVYLGINEGEYINSTDIDASGYSTAYKLPEVKMPKSQISPQIMFSKGYAQGYVTKLYNTFDKLSENISHPVVKGGGYGIDNKALYEYSPFALSIVGRAEDQQYYFNGLSKGLRGIFHPNLRIAHYKQSVQTSETKQKGTKFLGDMYRILIFSHLVEELGVKKDIDPFPGLFAGKLARCQYFLNLMYQSLCFAESGQEEIALYLLEKGIPELEELIEEIDNGSIKAMLSNEEAQWKKFSEAASKLDPEKTKSVMDSIRV